MHSTRKPDVTGITANGSKESLETQHLPSLGGDEVDDLTSTTKDIVAAAVYIKAVSYTHLDVYKRQGRLRDRR